MAPDVIRATVFDDLPQIIVTQEIFLRLPSRDVLRCGAVRATAFTSEFLYDHHRRQPSLPLVRHKVSPQNYEIDAFDIREALAERRHILGRYAGLYTGIHASCDGLLLLSRPNNRYRIVNPATQQRLPLPALTGAGPCNIKGMYPHPHRSGEYQILFWRGEREVRNSGYQILTVGYSKNQKPRCIGQCPVASACTRTDFLMAGRDSDPWHPPILLNGCLHWNLYYHPSLDGLLIFDTLEESFSSMRHPAAAARGTRYLLEMEGRLDMRCLDELIDGIMQIWVLQDYERVTWSLRCQIKLPSMERYCTSMLLWREKYSVLVYYVKPYLHQLCQDDNGKLLDGFQWEIDYPIITGYWFKESLVRHTFFRRQGGGHASQSRFLRML